MNQATPLTIARYLREQDTESKVLAYLELDENFCVKTSGGNLNLLGSDSLDVNRTVVSQIAMLDGLIPSGPEPVVIANAHFEEDLFFDLHLFTELGYQWVLLLDNTESGRNLQADQQDRLDNEILIEQAIKITKR